MIDVLVASRAVTVEGALRPAGDSTGDPWPAERGSFLAGWTRYHERVVSRRHKRWIEICACGMLERLPGGICWLQIERVGIDSGSHF